MIDRATRDRIQDAAQITEVVSDFVTLRRAGANYKGLCPFHDDTTPSFIVSPAKNYCKCFSCGKGGNPITFIMEHEHLSYPEALRYLAKKYNIEIQERELSPEEKQAQSSRESMSIINEWANEIFQDALYNTEEGKSIGINYLHTRGFRDDIVKKFQVGYCLNQADYIAQKAKNKGFNKQYILKTGLCYEKNDGSLKDRFWGRIIFPIHSISGKVVAFGGRVLSSATKGVQVKYVNSPESEIYHKGRELYGLFQAKQAIVKEDRCYIVEGYTDVIAMHQSGIENVVSSSGTALTYEQIRLIRRFTHHITLLFDSDEAGIKASLRGIDMLLEEDLSVKVLCFPEGEDPDSFARNKNAESYKAYIDNNQIDFIHFKARLLLKEASEDPIKRSEAITSIVRSIAVIKDTIVRAIYIQECSRITQLSEQTLINATNKVRESIKEELNKQKTRTNLAVAPIQSEASTSSELTEIPQQSKSVSSSSNESLPEEKTSTTGSLSNKEKQKTNLFSAERLLVQALIKYGDKPLFNVELESGEHTTIITAEFIVKELQQDGLTFYDTLHRKIFYETVDALTKKEILTERDFTYHQDPTISQLAGELVLERYQLSKYHTKTQNIVSDEERLYDIVPRLVFNFKFAVVKEELNQCMKKLLDPAITNNPEEYTQVMTQYKELKEVVHLLGKELGRF